MKAKGQPRIRIRTYEVAEEVIEQAPLDPSEARRVLQLALEAIPDEELRNFRGGHILVVK
jgi:hypothetical protein